MDLLTGLTFLRDELAKIPVTGWENIDRFSMCGRLLGTMIDAVNSAQNNTKEDTENARTTETNQRPAESGHN